MAAQSGKQIDANATTPGRVIAVVAGVNQNTLNTGIVAIAEVRVAENASNGSTELALVDTTFTSPDAQEVPSEGGRTMLAITNQSDDGGQSGAGGGSLRRTDMAQPSQEKSIPSAQEQEPAKNAETAVKNTPDLAKMLEEAKRLREGIQTPSSEDAQTDD